MHVFKNNKKNIEKIFKTLKSKKHAKNKKHKMFFTSMVIFAHNLTPLRRDDRNVAQVCVRHPFSGRTRRRLESCNKYILTHNTLLTVLKPVLNNA